MKKEVLFDILSVILAITSLLLLLFDHQHHFWWVNTIIIIIFFLFTLYMFMKSKHKWQFIKTHPFELIALIPLNGIFQGAMIVRLFRIFVVLKVLKKHFPRLSAILSMNGLSTILTYTFALILLAAIPIHYVEENIPTFADGIWWAIVTTTTVGYGDFSPVTPIGRMIATILMFAGIGCIGTITGSVASYLTKGKQLDDDKEYIKNKIDQLETLSNEEYQMVLDIMERKRTM